MEIRHLKAFVTLAGTLHFAQAAEQLDLSAPTLTAHIQELERALQVRLFNRTKRSVALTSAGEVFLIEARNTLEQLERTLNVGLRAGRGELGRVEIGYVGSAVFFGVLQDQCRRFHAAWPEVLVQTREMPTDQLASALEDGRIDIAFVRMPIVLPPSISSHMLIRDRFCVALPADHPLASATGAITARSLAREAFIVPEQILGLLEVARRGKFTPGVASTPGSLLTVLTHVSLGMGVAVVPSVLVEVMKLPNVVFRELAGAAIDSEVAALHRRHERSPAVRHFVDQIKRTTARA